MRDARRRSLVMAAALALLAWASWAAAQATQPPQEQETLPLCGEARPGVVPLSLDALKLLRYLREELLVVLGTSSTEPALPALLFKLENLGCSKEPQNCRVSSSEPASRRCFVSH